MNAYSTERVPIQSAPTQSVSLRTDGIKSFWDARFNRLSSIRAKSIEILTISSESFQCALNATGTGACLVKCVIFDCSANGFINFFHPYQCKVIIFLKPVKQEIYRWAGEVPDVKVFFNFQPDANVVKMLGLNAAILLEPGPKLLKMGEEVIIECDHQPGKNWARMAEVMGAAMIANGQKLGNHDSQIMTKSRNALPKPPSVLNPIQRNDSFDREEHNKSNENSSLRNDLLAERQKQIEHLQQRLDEQVATNIKLQLETENLKSEHDKQITSLNQHIEALQSENKEKTELCLEYEVKCIQFQQNFEANLGNETKFAQELSQITNSFQNEVITCRNDSKSLEDALDMLKTKFEALSQFQNQQEQKCIENNMQGSKDQQKQINQLKKQLLQKDLVIQKTNCDMIKLQMKHQAQLEHHQSNLLEQTENVDMKSQDPLGKSECSKCKQVILNATDRKIHEISCDGKDICVCSQCGLKCTQIQLMEHLIVHEQ